MMKELVGPAFMLTKTEVIGGLGAEEGNNLRFYSRSFKLLFLIQTERGWSKDGDRKSR